MQNMHTDDPEENIFSEIAYEDALFYVVSGARCSSVVRAFAHGAMGRRIDPSWGESIDLFLVPASAPRLG